MNQEQKPELEQELPPPPNLKLRLMILGVLLLPILIAPSLSIVMRFFSCFMPLVLTGTYRISKLTDVRFETQFFFAYIPMRRRKCKLNSVLEIEATYGNAQPGCITFLLFGPFQYLLGWIFDFLLPSLGGAYEIWLKTQKGAEILAWQGNNEDVFNENLEILRVRTSAEVRSRSGA